VSKEKSRPLTEELEEYNQEEMQKEGGKVEMEMRIFKQEQ